MAFRRAEKRYQLRKSEPPGSTDLRDVIDFRDLQANTPENRADIVEVEVEAGSLAKGQKCYTLKSHPGFYVLPGLLGEEECLNWAHFCLSECTSPPHVTNFDALGGPQEDLWGQAVAEWQASKAVTSEKSANKSSMLPKSGILRKLAWATLGYHFDWSSRCYHGDRQSPMPESFLSIGSRVADALRALHVAQKDGTKVNSLKVEAAIINFYKWDSYRPMGGHRDDLELTFDHPVVSISLGLDALFLLGGTTLSPGSSAGAGGNEDADASGSGCLPSIVACMVQQGDVMVLSGEARLAYHGVPRILRHLQSDADQQQHNGKQATACVDDRREGKGQQQEEEHPRQGIERKEPELELVRAYLRESRVNINLRQVLADGAAFPPAAPLLDSGHRRRSS